MKQFVKVFVQASKKNPAKVLQYVMLIFLFGLAFFLPFYGMQRQARESASDLVREETELRQEKGTIVLDAGHGGFDSGTVGSSGISEKELNLIYAKKLEGLLEEAGYRVVQTRNTEDGLYDETQNNKKAQDMQQRCAIIAQEQPLLTISIHQNSYPQDAAVCGPQVFYYEQSQEGQKLAFLIQKYLNEIPDVMRQRTEKGNASYYILKRSESTTVIVECGFLTNVQEEELLQQEMYQNQIVTAVCQGILEYLEGTEQQPHGLSE